MVLKVFGDFRGCGFLEAVVFGGDRAPKAADELESRCSDCWCDLG